MDEGRSTSVPLLERASSRRTFPAFRQLCCNPGKKHTLKRFFSLCSEINHVREENAEHSMFEGRNYPAVRVYLILCYTDSANLFRNLSDVALYWNGRTVAVTSRRTRFNSFLTTVISFFIFYSTSLPQKRCLLTKNLSLNVFFWHYGLHFISFRYPATFNAFSAVILYGKLSLIRLVISHFALVIIPDKPLPSDSSARTRLCKHPDRTCWRP